MGLSSFWHWIVLALVVLLLFGKGRFSDMMGDMAKGIKSFKKGMADDDTQVPPQQIEGPRAPDAPVAPTPTADRDRL